MKRHILPILLIGAIAIALYANTLKNSFVYDDEATIVNNNLIKDLHNLPILFKKDYLIFANEASYRPVVTLTYFLDYAFYGLNPWGYHLTNVLLHGCNAIMLYIFFKLLIYRLATPSKQLTAKCVLFDSPLLAASLFAVNPVLTEAVNAISYREDLLTFLFYIATLNLYIRLDSDFAGSRKRWFYPLSCLLYLLALFSKEMAVTLPLVIYLYELLREKNGVSGFRSMLPGRYNTGYLAITSVYLYLRFSYFKNPHDYLTSGKTLLNIPYIFLSNLKLILFPVSLSADHVVVFKGGLFFIFLSLVVVALLFLTAFVQKNKGIAFGFLFFAITLLPVCGIINLPHPLAERYLYLPATGLALVIGLTINRINISRPSVKGIFTGVFLVVIGIYAAGTIIRNSVWRDGYTLWSDTVKKSPNSYRARNGLGLFYLESGRFKEATEQFETALRLKTGDPGAHAMSHNNLGISFARQGRIDAAIQEFKIALSLKPDYPDAHFNLGMAYVDKNKLDEAEQEFKAALQLKPDHPDAHFNLGNIYSDLGRLDEAIMEYQASIRLKPSYPYAYYNLGIVYAKKQLFDEAINEFKKALEYDSKFIEARYNLGVAYLKKGLKDKAKEEFEIVQRSKPGLSQ